MLIHPVHLPQYTPRLFIREENLESFAERLMFLFEKMLGPSRKEDFILWDIGRSVARIIVYPALLWLSAAEMLFTGMQCSWNFRAAYLPLGSVSADTVALRIALERVRGFEDTLDNFAVVTLEVLFSSVFFWKKLDVPPELIAILRCRKDFLRSTFLDENIKIDEKSRRGKAFLHALILQSIQRDPLLAENLYPKDRSWKKSTSLPSLKFSDEEHTDLITTMKEFGLYRRKLNRGEIPMGEGNAQLLPQELWLTVFKHLPLSSLVESMGTCRAFYVVGKEAICDRLNKKVPLQKIVGLSSLISMMADRKSPLSFDERADVFLTCVNKGLTWEKAKELGLDLYFLDALFPSKRRFLQLSRLNHQTSDSWFYQISPFDYQAHPEDYQDSPWVSQTTAPWYYRHHDEYRHPKASLQWKKADFEISSEDLHRENEVVLTNLVNMLKSFAATQLSWQKIHDNDWKEFFLAIYKWGGNHSPGEFGMRYNTNTIIDLFLYISKMSSLNDREFFKTHFLKSLRTIRGSNEQLSTSQISKIKEALCLFGLGNLQVEFGVW